MQLADEKKLGYFCFARLWNRTQKSKCVQQIICFRANMEIVNAAILGITKICSKRILPTNCLGIATSNSNEKRKRQGDVPNQQTILIRRLLRRSKRTQYWLLELNDSNGTLGKWNCQSIAELWLRNSQGCRGIFLSEGAWKRVASYYRARKQGSGGEPFNFSIRTSLDCKEIPFWISKYTLS